MTVHLRREGAIAWLTLARPDAGNALDLPLALRMRDELRSLRDTDTRVVVIGAEGTMFSAGGDVHSMARADDPKAYLAQLAGAFHQALRALDELDAVSIAAVNGAAVGGGLGLALHADVLLASDRARFLTGYEKIGLTPDSGVSWLLPRSIGLHRALQLSVTGRELDAQTALQWGLVTEVLEHDGLDEAVRELAERLARNPTAHLARTRRLMRGDGGAHLDRERDGIADSATTDYARERIEQFTRRKERT
jgi:2-(1,2-epoxy-1,2-dihydrophenyl)acetyl-CoA isomerase